MQLSEALLSTNTFSVSCLSCRIVLQIKNFMLTRLLVNHLQVNIAYENLGAPNFCAGAPKKKS